MADKHPLIEAEINNVPETSGVYKIHRDLLPPFPRLNGETDIVYIGMAKLGKINNLQKRLMSLITGKGREAWPRFQKFKQAGFKLSFSYEECPNPKQREAEELEQYERNHLELPPFNRNMPKLPGS